jgi:hypothetical protein
LRQERPDLIHRFEDDGGGRCENENDVEFCYGGWLMRRHGHGDDRWHDENWIWACIYNISILILWMEIKVKNAPYGARTRDPGLIRSVL